ncbi:hypothetical protein ECC02_010076 [Trypanosoma cruzi]|uniref:Uncharacterized protein n=1 Tax=Trypanosoma cruzi TaxID=5693 RepID=A0A7J6XSU8_TRYCR|nr:hypothetical protein ECC02_010076 [Trypanosoma cruzi]
MQPCCRTVASRRPCSSSSSPLFSFTGVPFMSEWVVRLAMTSILNSRNTLAMLSTLFTTTRTVGLQSKMTAPMSARYGRWAAERLTCAMWPTCSKPLSGIVPGGRIRCRSSGIVKFLWLSRTVCWATATRRLCATDRLPSRNDCSRSRTTGGTDAWFASTQRGCVGAIESFFAADDGGGITCGFSSSSLCSSPGSEVGCGASITLRTPRMSYRQPRNAFSTSPRRWTGLTRNAINSTDASTRVRYDGGSSWSIGPFSPPPW